MTRERPILFSAEMVRAILDGRKTQTRRVVKPQWCVDHVENSDEVVHVHAANCPGYCDYGCKQQAPYGRPGDRLWVRETWCYADPDPGLHAQGKPEMWRPRDPNAGDGPSWCYYRATDTNIIATDGGFCGRNGSPWRPSIHMPRWASRITLEVTDVRVERLHGVSEDDARAEGAPVLGVPCAAEIRDKPTPTSHVVGFRELWCRINGNEAWDANPWVWVVEFRRVRDVT